jgi:cytochrome c peroxidase
MKFVLALVLGGTLLAEAGLNRPPLGLSLYMPVPLENPITHEKVSAGRKLFFDKRLSRDGTLSCAGCHDPKLSFSDGRALARGVDGAEGTRNSPALINVGYGSSFFWDGRAGSLEQLALQPLFNPKELGNTPAELERRTGMREGDIATALASYLRTIRSGDSSFDRYSAGQSGALTAIEKEGLVVFREKGRCTSCHAGPTFSDERFHNTGVAWRDGRFEDDGRFAVSEIERDRVAFKTPTLRDLIRTAPYMHNGSLATLEDVVEFYSEGGRQNPMLDTLIKPRDFTPHEKLALVSFLKTLTGRDQEGVR